MDELGVISSWSVIEIDNITDHDYNLSIGGHFKLLEIYTVNLQFMDGVFDGDDNAQAMDLEFDPNDRNIFYFSTSSSLFRCNRRDNDQVMQLDTKGLGAPTALSMSDCQYMLVGFSCGSIG